MIQSSNGTANEQAIATALQEESTVGYLPTTPLESLWVGNSEMPQITLRRDIEFMQIHPVVSNSLEYYKSGIAGAEFWGGPDHADPQNVMGKPISRDARVSEFVLSLVERFWRDAMPLLQEGGYPYGWAAGEHVYKESNGLLVWDHMKDFHPRDATVLSIKYHPVGVRIRNIREKEPVDLWFASDSVPAKACWYPHRPKFGQFYGRSQLIGAWRPWRRLGWRDGVEQVIDAAIYRAGYVGPIVRHPPEDMQTAQEGIPATKADARGMPRRSARDVARQMVEWAKAGAGFTLSSASYPTAQGGGKKWEIDWPEHVMDVRPLIEAARHLEDQIMLGIGVPPELVKAAGTGSGYSGRSIPREAFLDGQQKIANAMLCIFVEQVVRPLVLWNFGDVPFEVVCKSILQSQVQDKQGGGQQDQNNSKNLNRVDAAKRAWELRKQNQPQAPSAGAPPAPPDVQSQTAASAPMSLDPAVRERVLEIAERVLRRRAG